MSLAQICHAPAAQLLVRTALRIASTTGIVSNVTTICVPVTMSCSPATGRSATETKPLATSTDPATSMNMAVDQATVDAAQLPSPPVKVSTGSGADTDTITSAVKSAIGTKATMLTSAITLAELAKARKYIPKYKGPRRYSNVVTPRTRIPSQQLEKIASGSEPPSTAFLDIPGLGYMAQVPDVCLLKDDEGKTQLSFPVAFLLKGAAPDILKNMAAAFASTVENGAVITGPRTGSQKTVKVSFRNVSIASAVITFRQGRSLIGWFEIVRYNGTFGYRSSVSACKTTKAAALQLLSNYRDTVKHDFPMSLKIQGEHLIASFSSKGQVGQHRQVVVHQCRLANGGIIDHRLQSLVKEGTTGSTGRVSASGSRALITSAAKRMDRVG